MRGISLLAASFAKNTKLTENKLLGVKHIKVIKKPFALQTIIHALWKH
jgi:hypothetical protein